MQSSKSYYLHYLYGLNYWDTNAIFLCTLVLMFFNKSVRIFFILLLNFFIKFKFFNIYFFKKQLPDALLIGTISIHPIMFYFFMLIFLIKTLKISSRYVQNWLPMTHSRLSVFLSITLILGGFWGAQSTIWGYFWVNDSVEWLLLLAILSLLYSLHRFGMRTLSFNSFVLIFFLFNLVLMVRLNLFQTRHSFIEQRSLATFLLFGYLLFCECIFRRTYLNKTTTKYLIDRRVFALLFSFVIVIVFFALLFSKMFFLFLGVFFFRYLHPQAILYKTVGHILFFLFFFIWGIYFTFFYLIYTKVTALPDNVFYIFTDTVKFLSTFCFKKLEFKLLESVSFLVFSESIRQFTIFFGTAVSVLLNNWMLLYILCVLVILFL